MPLYAKPQPIRSWDEDSDEPAPHTSFLDLFLDLPFVAIASKVSHAVMHDPSPSSLLLALVTFVMCSSSWLGKLTFEACFVTEDTTHKALDMLEFTAVSITAINIHAVAHDPVPLLVGIALQQAILCARWAETYLTLPPCRPHALRSGFPKLGVLVATLLSMFLWDGTVWVAVAGLACDAGWQFVQLSLNRPHRRDGTVPLHVGYTAHRVGEFMMLMVGEGVLTICTARGHGAEFYVSAVAGLAIMGAMMLDEYSTSVFSRDKHVLHKSAKGGVVWATTTLTIHAFSLVMVGAGMGLLLGHPSGTAAPRAGTVLLAGSLASTSLFCELTEGLHAGSMFASGRRALTLSSAAVLGFVAVPVVGAALDLAVWQVLLLLCASCGVQALALLVDPAAAGLDGRFSHQLLHSPKPKTV